MKTFWKLLPLALPLLALVLVLSSCGKGNKITGNVFNRTKEDITKAVGAQRATGARDANALDPEAFRKRCSDPADLNGLIEPGPVCVINVKRQDLLSSGAATQPIVDLKGGELVITTVSAGTIPPATADIRLGGVHLLNFGERTMADRAGHLEFFLLGNVTAVASVSVWKCLDANLKDTGCPVNIFNH